jgi:purine-binding chemotaxis protein CheW
VVPILDLRRRFGLPAMDFGPTTVIIVVRMTGSDDRPVGIVVDAVSEVYNVNTAETKPPPEMCGDVDTIFVKSLATFDDKMLILLDIDRLVGNGVYYESSSAAA